jgi:hypothetical protein
LSYPLYRLLAQPTARMMIATMTVKTTPATTVPGKD